MKYTGWILFGPFLVVAMHISSTPTAAQDFPLYSTEDAGTRVGKIDADGNFEVLAGGLAGSFGLTVGTDGLVYVAEIDGDQVSTIDANGVVTLFACNLTIPTGVWFAPDGRLYCTEGNGEVTDISAGGDMFGVTPFVSGFNFPTGLAFDDDGTMYVADWDARFGAPPYPQGGYASRGVPISKVDANGQVTTFVDLDPLCVVGSNVFPVDLLCTVVNIEFGRDGFLYATQFGGAGSGVFRIDSNGQEVLIAKPGNDLSDNYAGLAIHKDGTLYVGDGGESEVYRVDPTDGTSAQFSVIVGNSPFGLAFTPSADADGDGVDDDIDACPDSDLSPTIILNGVNTGVSNDLLDDGCTIADLIAQLLEADASTNVIVQFLVDLKGDGIISGQDMGAILRALNSP